MNFRRGLFRLWIVGAVLFVIAVAFVSYSDIKAEFDRAAAVRAATLPPGFVLDEPEEGRPDVANLTDKRSLPNPWDKVGMASAIAFGIPLVVLALGASLVWAFSGFAATRP